MLLTEWPVEFVLCNSPRPGFRRVKTTTANGLEIWRDDQKGGGRGRGGCGRPFGDGELTVQFAGDGGHLALEVRGGRQRGLLGRTHDDSSRRSGSGSGGVGGGGNYLEAKHQAHYIELAAARSMIHEVEKDGGCG